MRWMAWPGLAPSSGLPSTRRSRSDRGRTGQLSKVRFVRPLPRPGCIVRSDYVCGAGRTIAVRIVPLRDITTGRALPPRRVGVVGADRYLIWGRVALHAFAAPILALDARVVGSVIGATVEGNTVHFANARGQFLIGGPCSSVHNISLAVVLSTQCRGPVQGACRCPHCGIWPRDGCNDVRNQYRAARAIGANPDSFDFLHHGIGEGLFGWAELIGARILAALGVSDAVARQR